MSKNTHAPKEKLLKDISVHTQCIMCISIMFIKKAIVDAVTSHNSNVYNAQ